MSQSKMTTFTQALGGFFAGSVKLVDVERAADAVVAQGVDTDHALAVIDKHLEAGRLAPSLHRILADRLSGATPPNDDDTRADATDPYPDSAAVGRQSDATAPVEREPVAPDSDLRSEDATAARRAALDATAAYLALTALDGADESDAQGADAHQTADAGVDSTAASSRTDASERDHADATAQLPREQHDVHDAQATLPLVDAAGDGAPSAAAMPDADAPRIPADPTERINSHVAPTVRIHKPDDPTVKLDTSQPDAAASAAHAQPDYAPQYEATQRIERPHEPTLPLAQVAKPEIEGSGDTQPLHSSQFPSQSLGTAQTGSNWLRPDQWTERHTGPLGPGSILKRRFLIESKLGKGGMGVVFKARDKRKEEASDRDPFVAIKVLNDTFREHPKALIALQREARKAQTLAHPNIITVYDFDRDGNRVYMTMELMRGEPLDKILRRKRDTGLELAQARTIIEEMAEGLAYAHQQNIIHSDFKPGNVFLTEDERVKILDFGIARARVFSGQTQSEQTLFDAGDLGSLTPAYASLEMFNAGTPHPADDVYALAITAYLVLTGKHPFDRKTAEQALELGLVPEPIKTLKRREWLAIAHGLALKREDRTRDAETFLREFRGTQKVTRFAAIVIAVLAGIAVYFAYLNTQDPGPAIPWEELTLAQQSEFEQLVSSGNGWLANDPPWIGGAYGEFAAAYDIHPRNRAATEGLDAVAAALVALADTPANNEDKRRLLDDINTASQNEYLAEHGALRRTRKRLQDELGVAR